MTYGLRIASPIVLAAALGGGWWARAQKRPAADQPQSVYARNANDPWNRIFESLFSRSVTFRYSADFPQGAPLGATSVGAAAAARDLQLSTAFERFESGDRAIDPLYRVDPRPPSPYHSAQPLLDEPLYTRFKDALRDAQNDRTGRSPLARALMQSDLWSAFDILDAYPADRFSEQPDVPLGMLAQLIKKVALTPSEVDALPDNFSLSVRKYGLPDIFRPSSGWLEVQWFTHRDHDEAASFRRVSRVFVKPAPPTGGDTQEFLDSLRGYGNNPVPVLDGVAIVNQLLLIDNRGNLRPSAITTDAEFRFFPKASDGTPNPTEIQQYELSRRLILKNGAAAGFVVEGNDAPAYLPGAGNDLRFASTPMLVKLRTRCAACHGSDLNLVLTFASHIAPTRSTTHVKQLDPASHAEADFVMSQKVNQQNWKDLLDYMSP